MKLNKALKQGKIGRWKDAQVRISPEGQNQWFVMLQDTDHKSFILANDDDQTITSENIDTLAQLIRSIGLKEFTVFL